MDVKQVDKPPEMGVPNIRYEERIDRTEVSTYYGAGKQLWSLLAEGIFKLPTAKGKTFSDEQLCKEWLAKKANDEQERYLGKSKLYGVKVKGHGRDPNFHRKIDKIEKRFVENQTRAEEDWKEE